MHNLDLAGEHADRIVVMERGGIAADGTAASIMDGPEIVRVFGVERRKGRWNLAGQAG
jgi:iron complex transport system ATP-binding protein